MSDHNEFPYAPDDWAIDKAKQVAAGEGIELTDDHWEVIRGIQEYFDKTEFFKPRQLLDALEERSTNHLVASSKLYNYLVKVSVLVVTAYLPCNQPFISTFI